MAKLKEAYEKRVRRQETQHLVHDQATKNVKHWEKNNQQEFPKAFTSPERATRQLEKKNG